jgi:hypothetical protein
MVHPTDGKVQDRGIVEGGRLMGYRIDRQESQFPFPVDRKRRTVCIQGPVSEVEHIVRLMLEIKFRTAPVFLKIPLSGDSMPALYFLGGKT